MSFEYFENIFSARYLTYLAPTFNIRDGIGTFSRQKRDGCQGFIGPLPSAFLDKRPDRYRDKKELPQR
jgi:hypothetical protein